MFLFCTILRNYISQKLQNLKMSMSRSVYTNHIRQKSFHTVTTAITHDCTIPYLVNVVRILIRMMLYAMQQHGKYWVNLLTPWCRVLLEQLTGLQLVKKFPAFHGTQRFITALTSVRHLSLSWASPTQSIYPHPTSWRSILILSTHLRLGLPSEITHYNAQFKIYPLDRILG